MALRKNGVTIEIVSVDYAPTAAKMIIRFVETINGRRVDGEERVTLPVIRSAKRTEAEQWIEGQAKALAQATGIAVAEINTARANAKDDDGKPKAKPPITGPEVDKIRRMVREQMISAQMSKLAGAEWREVVLQANKVAITAVAYRVLKILPRFAGAIDV